MPHLTQYEREEDQIERDYADGVIDAAERRAQLRDLQADYRAAAEEAAQAAYDNERSNW